MAYTVSEMTCKLLNYPTFHHLKRAFSGLSGTYLANFIKLGDILMQFNLQVEIVVIEWLVTERTMCKGNCQITAAAFFAKRNARMFLLVER